MLMDVARGMMMVVVVVVKGRVRGREMDDGI